MQEGNAMSIGKRIRYLNIAIMVLIAGLLAAIAITGTNQIALNNAQERRYESYLLADQLRQSSDDLTRLARTYVVTGNPEYERAYEHVLAVRNGDAARADGRTVSLRSLMEQKGFTEAEFAKLRESEDRSNELVHTETVAMNAVKGLFEDEEGNFTRRGEPDQEMARRIMFDEQYHAEKARIMEPIAEFEALLNERTRSAVEQYVMLGNAMLLLIGVLAVVLGALAFLFSRSVNTVLRRIVTQLSSSSDQIGSASSQMADSSQQLAAASGQQAASLEETTSTMEEIASASRLTAERSREAQNLSSESRTTVESGSEQVTAMMRSIRDMKNSSDETMRIIKTIDEIAFQTNLLSLNAAVEAARAGDAGRGFAVVAEEVRNLALRSANAAQETSELLQSSARKAEDGVEAVEQVEALLANINNSMERLNALVSDVAGAVGEQLQGIEQVNTSVQQMNDLTQSNSANAEETASSSEELSAQVSELSHLVVELSRVVGNVKEEKAGDATAGNDGQRTRGGKAVAHAGGHYLPQPKGSHAWQHQERSGGGNGHNAAHTGSGASRGSADGSGHSTGRAGNGQAGQHGTAGQQGSLAERISRLDDSDFEQIR